MMYRDRFTPSRFTVAAPPVAPGSFTPQRVGASGPLLAGATFTFTFTFTTP